MINATVNGNPIPYPILFNILNNPDNNYPLQSHILVINTENEHYVSAYKVGPNLYFKNAGSHYGGFGLSHAMVPPMSGQQLVKAIKSWVLNQDNNNNIQQQGGKKSRKNRKSHRKASRKAHRKNTRKASHRK